jgi:hypothetical protein
MMCCRMSGFLCGLRGTSVHVIQKADMQLNSAGIFLIGILGGGGEF